MAEIYLRFCNFTMISTLKNVAGWSSLEARRAHNPKVIGSNPIPATQVNVRVAFALWKPLALVGI